MAQTYQAPPAMANQTVDVVHARMLGFIPASVDKREGGGVWDLTRPAATEIALMVNRLNVALQIMFPQYAYGEWLDRHAEAVGLTRKQANAASGSVRVMGDAGVSIPRGFLFATPSLDDEPNIEFEAVEGISIGAGGECYVPVRCTVGGGLGNVDAHTIALMVSPIKGISGVTNPAALSGGTEAERDESLRARIGQLDRAVESSFVGSTKDYTRWALEVQGVGAVTVVPEWDGPGTVKLIVVDDNMQIANDEILLKVYQHIMAPDQPGERLAPIGANVTVVAPERFEVYVVAGVTIDDASSLGAVQQRFNAALAGYFAAVSGQLRYSQIARVLAGVEGVVDYQGLLVNGGTDNIALKDGELPVVKGEGLVIA